VWLSGPHLAGEDSGARCEGLGHHLSHPQERGEFPDERVLSVGDRLQVEACGCDVAVEQLLLDLGQLRAHRLHEQGKRVYGFPTS